MTDQPILRIDNLAANACPLTPLLVTMIEYVSPLNLQGCRLRDAWLSAGPSGPQVNFAVAIGGNLRGGENGSLWGRLRRHELFISDADMANDDMPEEARKYFANWAVVSFLVPGLCKRHVERILLGVHLLTEDPVEKFSHGLLSLWGRGGEVKQKSCAYPAETVRGLLHQLAMSVEMLKGNIATDKG